MLFKTRRIFVSHSSNDDQFADKLAKELTSRGLKPFVDHHPKTGIIPGEDWLRALRRSLGRTQAVLILVSDGWHRSEWCQAEYRTAKLLNKPIIPVVIENSTYGDIEPSLQKIILDRGAGAVSPDAIDAIARALPNRILANSLVSAGIVMPLLIAAMGVENTPYGRWDAATLRGGAFVDLLRDPGKNDALFALAVNTFGRRGLFSSPDCGNTWSKIALPEALTDPNRLDVTADEILVASDNGLWILNKFSQRWANPKLEGLSERVLVAKVVPLQPDKIIYGTQSLGGISAGGVAVSENNEPLRAREGGGGATILDRRTDQTRSFPFQMNDVAFHPIDPAKIAVAAANDGVFISRDGLTTVTKIGKFDWGAPVNVSFDDQGDTVYVGSENGLSSFKFPVSENEQPEVRHLFAVPGGEAHGVAFGRDGRMILATTVGLFAAETRGAEFSPVVPAPLEKHVNKVLFCGERTLAATGGYGVVSFSQGDAAWQQVLTSTGNFAAFSGATTGSFRIVSAGPYVFRSLDGGRTFEAVVAPRAIGTTISIWEPPSETGSPTDELLRNRSQTARASYLYSKSSILAGFGEGKILRKPPGSVAWIAVANENDTQTPVNTITRSVTNPQLVVATFQDGQPILSVDDGESWISIDGLARDQALLAFALEDGRYLLSGRDGKVRTFDPRTKAVTTGSSNSQKPIAGYTFNPSLGLSVVVDIGGDVYSLEKPSLELREIANVPVNPETEWIDLYCCDGEKGMYLGGKSMGLLRSMDGGKSWDKLSDISIYALGPGPAERPSLYSEIGLLQVSNQGKICISDTNCLSWTAAAIVSRASMLWARLRQGVESIGWTVRNAKEQIKQTHVLQHNVLYVTLMLKALSTKIGASWPANNSSFDELSPSAQRFQTPQ
jgi:hypothetical protein